MTPTEYTKLAKALALYPVKHEIPYLALGLAGEAGEVANKAKKMLRGDFGQFFAGEPVYTEDGEFVGHRSGVVLTTPEASEAYDKFLADVREELGDVLWYFSQLLIVFGTTFEEVMLNNINKLHKRQGKPPYVEGSLAD